MLHLRSINPFVDIYKHAHEILSAEAERQSNESNDEPFHIRLTPQMKMELIVGSDKRTQNLPTVNEIAAIIPNKYSGCSFRDIFISYRDVNRAENTGLFKRISETHAAAYMPLHYVLLFPAGEYGWCWSMRLSSGIERLEQREFCRFRLHPRSDEFKIIYQSRKLFQQFLVDVCAICCDNSSKNNALK